MKTFTFNRKVIRDYCIGWTFACVLLSIIRGVGTTELGILKFGLKEGLLLATTFGPIIGLISGIWQLILEDKIHKTISIKAFLLIRFLYAIVFILFLIIISYSIYSIYFGITVDIVKFAFDTGALVVYFYVLFIDLLLNLFRQINLMLGNGNLGKLIRGDFYSPREEERIFMFIDLRSSTKLAEDLGNMKYSKLIQDCFTDLSVVMEFGAEIYQYVGDEVVLTWKLKNGLKNQNCLKAFFSFKNQLNKRKTYYMEQYGVMPYFKAGANYGKVTVVEVGKFKKEIAYHGDAINIAARIQHKCNVYNADLLISNQLLSSLPFDKAYSFKICESIQLRGKTATTTIYSASDHKKMILEQETAA